MSDGRPLAQVHGLVGPWFRDPRALPDLDALCVQFDRDGFAGPVTVLDGAGLAAVTTGVDRIMADLPRYEPELYEVEAGHRSRPDEVVCHFLGGWRVDPALHDLAFHPGLTAIARALLGVEGLRLWHDQVFAKPARHPGVVPWHQDYAYWTRTEPECHVTAHVAVDRADEDNGCLRYVPGSHRWGLLPKVAFDGPIDQVREHVPRDAPWREVSMRLQPGEVVFHHSRILHGSGANRSDRPRRACVVNWMGAHVRSASNEPLLRGTVPVARGGVVEGECFPLV